MHDAALRALYHQVTLHLNDHNGHTHNSIPHMFTRENPGIEHIRHVRIRYEKARDGCSLAQKLYVGALKTLISGLPKNNLLSFT